MFFNKKGRVKGCEFSRVHTLPTSKDCCECQRGSYGASYRENSPHTTKEKLCNQPYSRLPCTPMIGFGAWTAIKGVRRKCGCDCYTPISLEPSGGYYSHDFYNKWGRNCRFGCASSLIRTLPKWFESTLPYLCSFCVVVTLFVFHNLNC